MQTRPRNQAGVDVVVRLLAVLTLVLAANYVAWRWTDSVAWGAWPLSVPFVLAETHAGLCLVLLCLTLSRTTRRIPPAPPSGLSVDVFVTRYDEPVELLRRTVRSAVAIAYPHRTYVLDDGAAPEVASMARSEGAHYLARTRAPEGAHVDAKAGNLNHALRHTAGDFVLVLDADQVAHPDFLDRTLGYFDDPQVVFVQTPQWSYNVPRPDPLGAQTPFFNGPVQRGKDAWNAALFTGSNAVLRRRALQHARDEGIATYSLTEDLATTIRLHAAGGRGVYHDEVLAEGLAPGDLEALLSQRRRWAVGALQVLRREAPLTARGLSVGQRLMYLETMLRYFSGFATATLAIVTALALTFGWWPVDSYDASLLARAIPLALANEVLLLTAMRGPGAVRERQLSIALWPVWIEAACTALAPARAPATPSFEVTPKDGATRRASLKLLRWQLGAAALLIGSVLVAGIRLAAGVEDDLNAVVVHLAWAAYLLGGLAMLPAAWAYRRNAVPSSAPALEREVPR